MWDAENMFSIKQLLAAADSTNIVDVGIGDAGKSNVKLSVVVGAGAAGTLVVTLKTANSPDMTGAVTVAAFTVQPGTIAKGGDVLVAALPTGCKRYLRLSYAGVTTGTVTAGLVWGAQTPI